MIKSLSLFNLSFFGSRALGFGEEQPCFLLTLQI
nr:MAG TPA: hypothetical protein [Caudoviricetes sp.]